MKSRKNPKRKEKLSNYKQKNKKVKQMSTQQPQSQGFGLPEIRQSPVWNSNDMLEISGEEWNTIFNYIESGNQALYAANAVMSRNIVNGKVKLKFDKLNKDKNGYDEMTPEEEAPYQAEVQAAIEKAIEMQKNQQKIEVIDDQKDLPRLDALVGLDGETPISSETTEKPKLIVV